MNLFDHSIFKIEFNLPSLILFWILILLIGPILLSSFWLKIIHIFVILFHNWIFMIFRFDCRKKLIMRLNIWILLIKRNIFHFLGGKQMEIAYSKMKEIWRHYYLAHAFIDWFQMMIPFLVNPIIFRNVLNTRPCHRCYLIGLIKLLLLVQIKYLFSM